MIAMKSRSRRFMWCITTWTHGPIATTIRSVLEYPPWHFGQHRYRIVSTDKRRNRLQVQEQNLPFSMAVKAMGSTSTRSTDWESQPRQSATTLLGCTASLPAAVYTQYMALPQIWDAAPYEVLAHPPVLCCVAHPTSQMIDRQMIPDNK